MRHMIVEIWTCEDDATKIHALITSPAYGVPREPIPLFDAIVQRLTLNDGEIRVSVIVYRQKIAVPEIQRVARIVVDRCL